MEEKLTIVVSSEHKKFIKRYARKQNKSVSGLIDNMLSPIKRHLPLKKQMMNGLSKQPAFIIRVKKMYLKNYL
ncbi:DUF6364 family protein [Parafilimonas sp.]|uniref:DUF6364 family protein n=1 Tax=Parafilimonas sp. TaxID=1969739 RepID=UPI0039E3500F